MNSIYTNTVIREIKGSLIYLAIILCLLMSGVLYLQSIKFASSLWVLLEFSYSEWQKYLLGILESLVIWAIQTGIIFSIQFYIYAPAGNLKKMLSSMAIGFISGFIFTYFLVLVIGIIIYIPLGVTSIFLPDIIKFATLEFAWLVAAYIVFIFIAIDTPRILYQVIKKGNWYSKLMGILMATLLVVQAIKAIAGGMLIIIENSIWRTNPSVIAMGAALLVTIVTNILIIRRISIARVIFAIIIIYIASLVTGNVSYGVLHWGEIPSFVLSAFIGPIAYSFVAKIIIRYEINVVSVIYGLVGGIVIGLMIDHNTKLRIIGQGWFGIMCGTLITISFGIGFGLIWGPALIKLLADKARINPLSAFCIGAGLFLGIIAGMVSGGFMAI